MGYCNEEMQREIDSTMQDIKLFSARMEGQSDDTILHFAEQLVEDIKHMIDAKKTIKENLEYESRHN